MIKIFAGKSVYLRRHLVVIIRHITIRKIINVIINQIELYLRRERLISWPVFLKIEPTPLCQLMCGGCPQRKPEVKRSFPSSAFLNLEGFRRIVDSVADTTLGISLSQKGEPMLNKELIPMIEYANSKNIGVNFPTNFSFNFSDDYFERLVKSGLDKIMISCDGYSKETYEKYRIGGNFELVTNNVRRLSEIKKKLHRKTPMIEWKFIVFDHNKHEVEEVRKNYKALGFDCMSLEYDYRSGISKKEHRKQAISKKNCFWIYNTLHVNWDGSISPCCQSMVRGQMVDWDIGNAVDDNIKLLWNNKRYRALRKSFSLKNYGKGMNSVCKDCVFFGS